MEILSSKNEETTFPEIRTTDININKTTKTPLEITKKMINPYDLTDQTSKYLSTTFHPEILLQKSDLKYLPNYLNQAFDSVEGVYHYLSFDEKIDSFLKIVIDTSQKVTLRLGSLIAVYLLLFHDKNKYSKIKDLQNLCLNILNNYQNYYELFLCISLDILSLIDDRKILNENINLISLFITDDNFPYLQNSTFNCLFRLSFPGIKILIDISAKYPKYQEYILSKLIETPNIIHLIIVKGLINELTNNKNSIQKINDALLALNQLYWIVSGEENYEYIISNLYEDKRIDNFFISSVLRTSGLLGNKILLNLCRKHRDFSVRTSICRALSHRINNIKQFLKIKINFDRNEYLNNKNCLFKYHLTDNLPVCDDNFNENNENYLEVFSEAFLAALNRLTSKNYNNCCHPIMTFEGHCSNSIFSFHNLNLDKINNLQPLKSHYEEFNKESDFNYISLYKINNEFIKVLCSNLTDKNSFVRQSSVDALIKIGLPETQNSLKEILNILQSNFEQDENILSSLIKGLSTLKLTSNTNDIINLIRFNFKKFNLNSKVIQSTLLLIPQIKNKCPNDILEYLTNALLTVHVDLISFAKAILFSGNEGELILINLFNTKKNIYKLISNIADSFKFTDPNSENIDLIIETLIENKNSKSALVRKNILITINYLSKYIDISTYLLNKNILDIYYNSLDDFDENISFICLEKLLENGAKAELMFIQGLRLEKNAKLRVMCAIGLGELGVQNIGTLLISFFEDKDNFVKENIEKILLEKFNNNIAMNKILTYYKNDDKIVQRNALLECIKDIIQKMSVDYLFREFLEKLKMELS